MMKRDFFEIYQVVSLCIFFGVFFFLLSKPDMALAAGGPSPCITDPLNFDSIEKRLLPLPTECKAITGYDPETGLDRGTYCGRGGFTSGLYSPAPFCITPTHIVMHTAKGDTTADGNYTYFANGAGGNGTGAHFVVGQDGKMLHMIEMGRTQVEYAQAVGPFDPHISIEMGSPAGFETGLYTSKEDMITRGSQLQYDNVLKLVKTLMTLYNIPIDRVVTHKSLGGPALDPGDGWMDDFLKDLPNATGLDGVIGGGSGTAYGTSQQCISKVGDPESRGIEAPGPLGCSGAAGNYKLPLDSATSIASEMASYPGDFCWPSCDGGHVEHAGLDIGSPIGERAIVYAITDGVVDGIYIGGAEISDINTCLDTDPDPDSNGAGCTIRLTHSGDSFTSWYTHVNPNVHKGQQIKRGETIARVHAWTTGNDHLHFELRETATNKNIQPRNYFPELQIIPVVPEYYGGIRAHSASRGIYLLEDGKEFAEMFRDHPPCSFEPEPGWCWAF